jgi:hypothetical protein
MVRTFAKCESVLLDQTYHLIEGLIVCFKKAPTIMTVGGFSPEFDYQGRLLQRLGRAEATYERVGLSILATKGKAAVVFTWIAEADVCRRFALSFIEQDARLLLTLAIQTAFEHLENTCMNIPWWDSLRPVEREKLLERMQFAGSSFEERTRACLQFCGINFDQWDYANFASVGKTGQP